MWEKLVNIDKQINLPKEEARFLNNRHRYSIIVQDKFFKIKRNPNYIYPAKTKNQNKTDINELNLENKVALAQSNAEQNQIIVDNKED